MNILKALMVFSIVSSCTATLRGSFLDIEELTFGPSKQKSEILKEIVTEPSIGVVDAADQK